MKTVNFFWGQGRVRVLCTFIQDLILVLTKGRDNIASGLGMFNILNKRSVLVASTEYVVKSLPSRPLVHDHRRLFLVYVTCNLVVVRIVMKVQLKHIVPCVFESRDVVAVTLEQVVIHAVSDCIQNVLGTRDHILCFMGCGSGMRIRSAQCRVVPWHSNAIYPFLVKTSMVTVSHGTLLPRLATSFVASKMMRWRKLMTVISLVAFF